MTLLSLENLIEFSHHRTQQTLEYYLQNTASPLLEKVMKYAVFNGGKRLRPLLVYATAYACDIPLEEVDAPAAAIECIHAYSLVHDDLPAMDNADLRRGKPSCHKAFNEALAILAGDALQALAFRILSLHTEKISAETRIKRIALLSHASGKNGMVAGQVVDITGVHSIEELTRMYQLKTGALLEAAILLGASSQAFQPIFLEKYAKNVGFAFQLQDDLLDFESSPITGKSSGLDTRNQKITYPTLSSIEKTREKIRALFETAIESIPSSHPKKNIFENLAHYLLHRQY